MNKLSGFGSLLGSSVLGILQARILQWVAIFPPPGDLPSPGIKSTCPPLQADALPSELLGKLTRFRMHALLYTISYALVLLSITDSSFIPITTNDPLSFLFLWLIFDCVSICPSFFSHLSVDGHLCGLHVLPTVVALL